MRIELSLSLPRDGVSVPITRHMTAEALSELGVDTECASDIDVVVMNEAPPALAQNIIGKGKLVFERSRSARVAFQIRALNLFLDTEPMRRAYLQALKRRYLSRG